MMRTVNIILIGGMMAGAGVVYFLKYEAEHATTRVAQLSRQIQQEREAIATLRAEWSLLNQPKRLQEMADRYHTYLELEPLDPNQVATLDDIPFRQVMPDGGTAGGKGPERLFAGVKPIEHTGTIRKSTDRVGKTDKPEPKGVDPKPNDLLNTIIR
ncbi:cell division protein FtsL [Prosthecomicrobium hirschii]|uniref:cell division protein FtsL n=1 Tax=Prosthecodimorpha hirschii TaxID=665126 RepID=UPI0015E30D24|nr:hypothetical protein [Prosthecomicrobium hirschii]MCW1838654.1 hypothetical protein [Prosthecomicrobium hirschii]